MNTKKIRLLLCCILLAIPIIFFTLLPVYGLVDYYSENVASTFFILVIISALFICFLRLEYKLIKNGYCVPKGFRIMSKVTMLFVELWALKTFLNIRTLITSYGGLEYDRLIAMLYTCTVIVVILFQVILNYTEKTKNISKKGIKNNFWI